MQNDMKGLAAEKTAAGVLFLVMGAAVMGMPLIVMVIRIFPMGVVTAAVFAIVMRRRAGVQQAMQ